MERNEEEGLEQWVETTTAGVVEPIVIGLAALGICIAVAIVVIPGFIAKGFLYVYDRVTT